MYTKLNIEQLSALVEELRSAKEIINTSLNNWRIQLKRISELGYMEGTVEDAISGAYSKLVTTANNFADSQEKLKDALQQIQDKAKAIDEEQGEKEKDIFDSDPFNFTGGNKGGNTEGTDNGSGSSTGKIYGDLDMDHYSHKLDPNAPEPGPYGLERSVLVAKYLVDNGGFTKEQAAALAGVYWDENGCLPEEVMIDEYRKHAGTQNYGAGIASLTPPAVKNQYLKDAGLPAGTPIETLSMQQQCDMIIAASQKSNKYYYDALKRCDTIEDASATAVVLTGGVSYSDNWKTHPTPADAKKVANIYGRANDNRYNPSEYHWGLDERRLEKAKLVLAEL